MQHTVKATGQTGKFVSTSNDKTLLELPAKQSHEEPQLQWFDNNELEQLTDLQIPTKPVAAKKKPVAAKKKPVVKNKNK